MHDSSKVAIITELTKDLAIDIAVWEKEGHTTMYGGHPKGRVDATKAGILRNIRVIRQKLLQLEMDIKR